MKICWLYFLSFRNLYSLNNINFPSSMPTTNNEIIECCGKRFSYFVQWLNKPLITIILFRWVEKFILFFIFIRWLLILLNDKSNQMWGRKPCNFYTKLNCLGWWNFDGKVSTWKFWLYFEVPGAFIILNFGGWGRLVLKKHNN
jgi:hypothetical protein